MVQVDISRKKGILRGQQYKALLVQGQSTDTIAEIFGVRPQTVRIGLRRAGYLIPARPVPPYGEGDGNYFRVSRRLAAAAREFADRDADLRRGLKLLRDHPIRLVPENIGKGEKVTAICWSHMTEEDNALIKKLARRIYGGSRSMIIRLAIEEIILADKMTAFYRPDDWEPRPLVPAQGVSPAASPEPLKAITIQVPGWIHENIAHLIGKTGVPGGFSGRVRSLLDEMIKTGEIASVKPISSKSGGKNEQVSALLYKRQIDWLDRNLPSSRADVLRGVLAHL